MLLLILLLEISLADGLSRTTKPLWCRYATLQSSIQPLHHLCCRRQQFRRSIEFQRLSSTSVSISDAYDGGNIEYVGQAVSSTDNDPDGTFDVVVSLKIKPDPYTELEKVSHSQYFSFRSTVKLDVGDKSDKTMSVRYEILNAGETSYAVAWDGSSIFYSPFLGDPDAWQRKLDTIYQKEEGKLIWSHNHNARNHTLSVYFAYFPPFSYARHLDLVERCSQYAKVTSLGHTLLGRELECVQVGKGERVGWIIHRQHPGEHMAEFYAEGLLTRLLALDSKGDADGLVRRLLDKYTLYIVPSMNPDGAVAGHLRTNAGGANLNREWCGSEGYPAPSMERSPEVYNVLEAMKQTGCDIFLDIHGDEEIPYNFLAQPTVPNWGPRLRALHGAFLAAYCRSNPDMQHIFAYEPRTYVDGMAVDNVATNQVAYRFDCLSATLEMPFKDCWSNPNPTRGWSPARSRALGASLLEALHYIHPYLRREADKDDTYWNDLTELDKYIRPSSQYRG